MTNGTAERLTAADGHTFDCWFVPATGEPVGGIVILQEIFGVTDQLKGLANYYSGLGFDVAIPALFDRREPGTVVPFDAGAKGRDLMLSLPADEVMQDVKAAVDRLAQNGDKVGIVGFCWGGGLAVRAAQTLDVGGAVAFYGTRLPNYMADDLQAPLQMHFGASDDHIPAEMRDGFLARYPEVEAHLYDAGHAFANDARPAAFDAEAAERAQQRAVAFLKKALA